MQKGQKVPGALRAPGRGCEEMQGFTKVLRQIGHPPPGALRAPGQECEEMQGFIRVLRAKDRIFSPARFARRARGSPCESENSFLFSSPIARIREVKKVTRKKCILQNSFHFSF